jgi:hypothetical protein
MQSFPFSKAERGAHEIFGAIEMANLPIQDQRISNDCQQF